MTQQLEDHAHYWFKPNSSLNWRVGRYYEAVSSQGIMQCGSDHWYPLSECYVHPVKIVSPADV